MIHSNLDTHKEIPLPDIQGFFYLENIGIEDPQETSQLTAEEHKAEDLMKANTGYAKVKKCWHNKLLRADSPIQYSKEKGASSTATKVIKNFLSPIQKVLPLKKDIPLLDQKYLLSIKLCG